MTENGPLAKQLRAEEGARGVPDVRGGAGRLSADQRFEHWRENHVPLLYDWLNSRRTHWPSNCIQWGKQLPQEYGRDGNRKGGDSIWSLYISERTAELPQANTLLFYGVRVRKEFTTRAEDVAKSWTDEARSAEGLSCPGFHLIKRVVHRGEVNRVKCLKRDWVATHTDSPLIYVWDMRAQEHREENSAKELYNTPTLTLVGHEGPAQYALSTASTEDESSIWIASGGRDSKVLVWKLEDFETAGSMMRHSVQFKGHIGTIEDVSFCPADRNMIASVGHDSAMILWDIRTPLQYTTKVANAHDGDIVAVDWGVTDNFLLISGGQDGFVRLWDRRRLHDSSGGRRPVFEFREHTDQVLGVQWNPSVPGIFASHSEDGLVIVWDITRMNKSATVCAAPGKSGGAIQPGVLFRHCGHRYRVADAQWLPDESDPWCIASVSEDKNGEGSTLQIWRMFDMIHREADEVKNEIQRM